MEKESFRGKEPAVKQLGGRVGGGRSITFLRTAFAHSQEKEREITKLEQQHVEEAINPSFHFTLTETQQQSKERNISSCVHSEHN